MQMTNFYNYLKSATKPKKIFLMLALAASVIFLCCGFLVTLPKNTIIDGVEVGGKTRSAAVQIVRETLCENLKKRRLDICVNDDVYTYAYPEISFNDNLIETVKKIRKSGTYASTKRFFLLGVDEILSDFSKNYDILPTAAKAEFSPVKKPFEYTADLKGREIDRQRLKRDIENSLNGDFERVKAVFKETTHFETLTKVKARTRLISTFKTYYDSSNTARANNISLACAFLNGRQILPDKTLSFNDTVGVRSRERGFLDAKIILNGEYVEGVGGGVCQVSTTLYNAALLAGMDIVEFHPHSLKVEYVPPSQDAMVSGKYMDLKIKNSSKTPIYMRANAHNGTLSVEIYGKKQGEFNVSSQLVGEVEPKIEYVDEQSLVREGKAGVKSMSFLEKTVNGKTEKVLLRKDRYNAISTRKMLEVPQN